MLSRINERKLQQSIKKKQYYNVAKRFWNKNRDDRIFIFDKLIKMNTKSQPFIVAIINYFNMNFKQKNKANFTCCDTYSTILSYKEKYESEISCNEEPVPFVYYYWCQYCNALLTVSPVSHCLELSEYIEQARNGIPYFDLCVLYRYEAALKKAVRYMPELKPILCGELEWFLNQLSEQDKNVILCTYFELVKKLLIEYGIAEPEHAGELLTDFLTGKIKMIGTHKGGPRKDI